ncbi:MAG: hypothetical protein ABIQ59_17580 [Nocardioidaceae bacterium]
MLTSFISGNTFRARAVQYVVVDGLAMFEGDIVLDTAEQVARDSEVLASELRGELASGVIDAIAHWQTNTGFTFVAGPGERRELPRLSDLPAEQRVLLVGRQAGRAASS